MLFRIVSGAPFWVWPVLAFLIVTGLIQTRRRVVSARLALILPAVMLGLALYGAVSTGARSPGLLGAWIVGVAVAIAANERIMLSPRGARYLPASRQFDVPGSILPLVLNLGIFCARFAVGVVTAVAPSFAAEPGFALGTSATLGLLGGLFLARALRMLLVTRAAARVAVA
jgi:hypothetical protein